MSSKQDQAALTLARLVILQREHEARNAALNRFVQSKQPVKIDIGPLLIPCIVVAWAMLGMMNGGWL